VNATGVVQTALTVQVGSQVSGQVQELYADFNSVVKRGQLLAKLDTRNLESQVANARASVTAARARVRSAEAEIKTHSANLQSSHANRQASEAARAYARIQYERAVELHKKSLISKSELDNAKSNVDSAEAKYDQTMAAVQQVEAQTTSIEAQIAQAKAGLEQSEADLSRALINLEYANIFSPVDGVVISRDVDVGQTIAASMQAPTLFSIATDLGQMQVKASVDEADIGQISEDKPVTFTVDAYPNETFTGTIAEIRLSPQTLRNVVTYSVIVSIQNRDLKLKPGMTANITITVAERTNVVKVPNAALRYTPPNTAVQPPAGSVSHEGILEDSSETTGESSRVAIPLAPGQKWNPDEKLRFVAPDRAPHHSGTVWVLDAAGKPQRRDVTLGITDGASTEVVAGDLTGTAVIVGDSTQVDTANQAQPGFFFGRGRGGF
jgi:HlyD family secretion protein